MEPGFVQGLVTQHLMVDLGARQISADSFSLRAASKLPTKRLVANLGTRQSSIESMSKIAASQTWVSTHSIW